MNEQEISLLIDTSLQAIESGQATLEDILRQNPQIEEILRPELEAGLWLVSQREQVRSRPGFVSASRRRVMTRIQQEANSRGARRSFLGLAWPRRLALQWGIAALLIIFLIAGTGGVVSASQGTLPGEPLYGVKRIVEQTSLSLTADPIERVALSSTYSERRLSEAEALIVQGEYEVIEETLTAYEEEVNRSLTLLKEVSDVKPERTKDLAIALRDNLDKHEERIESLAESVPEVVQEELVRAEEVSSRAAASALQIAEDAELQSTVTPTVTKTATKRPRMTRTATLRPTLTRVPFTRTPSPVPTIESPVQIPWDTPTLLPVIPPTSTIPPRPTFTATPLPTSTITDTPVPPPTETPEPTTTDTPVPPPTETPEPTDTFVLPTTAPDPTDTSEPTLIPDPPLPTLSAGGEDENPRPTKKPSKTPKPDRDTDSVDTATPEPPTPGPTMLALDPETATPEVEQAAEETETPTSEPPLEGQGGTEEDGLDWSDVYEFLADHLSLD